MTEQTVLLSRLLDKYEKSKHLLEPGASSRRVMLRVEKKEFPEYRYEDASIRDAYNAAAQDLEQRGLVLLEWVQGRPVLFAVILSLEHVLESYALAGRTHPKVLADRVAALVSTGLNGVTVPWIAAWRDEVSAQARSRMKVPPFCKEGDTLLKALLTSFQEYDALHGSSMTMRGFSNRCYHDTKYFERVVREPFLRIARTYDPALAAACEENHMSERDQLAFLGIYARPELYEMAGNIGVKTQNGFIDFSAAAPYGLALPSTMVDSILGFDLDGIRRIVLMENKTNYDEYLISEQQPWELAVYHGGFLSPQKRKLFAFLAGSAMENTEILFWADIDLGGFQMFSQLQLLFPNLKPMRMSGDWVERFHAGGLPRSKSYLEKLKTALQNCEYPLFSHAMAKILEYGVTIEQECFLNEGAKSSTAAPG